MDYLSLPRTGRLTTRIGFGCAYLLPENATVLDAAYDAGIRHFDVARSYGRGLSEGVLRQFIRRHGDSITITTKYGILPPPSGGAIRLLRTILRPLAGQLRRSAVLDRSITQSIATLYRRGDFSQRDAARSLLRSLARLGVERVDLFLMHEASVGELSEVELHDWLIETRGRGIVGEFGVAGSSLRVPELISRRPGYCNALQYDWSAERPISPPAGRFEILYRSLSDGASAVRSRLAYDPALVDRWSEEVNLDLRQPGLIERLMFRAAYDLRPDAMLLFSAKSASWIIGNIRAIEDPTFGAAGTRLVTLLMAQTDTHVGTE